jgi:protein-S-isoprenylcysteine O-methyltransferase Ste14
VVVFVCSCNVARALVEEQLLVTSTRYEEYRCHVRWRLVPGIW